jgi:hypothetical protein
MRAPASGHLLAVAACTLLLALAAAWPAAQARQPFPGTLDEHPAIQYETRPTTDAVARLDARLAAGEARLARDARMGWLPAVLSALDVPVESQLLVFSKTGLQRAYTGPKSPRALYYGASVVVGYIPGAPALELASHDPRQGVIFYTLEQDATAPPRFRRRAECLTCHLSSVTDDVPGLIVRSNMVGHDGFVMPRLGSFTVDHRTPHTERWGGWFVTGHAAMPPYGPLGHLGNLTVTPHPTAGPAILSNHVLVEWQNRPMADDPYPSSDSDLAALMTFDHQMPGLNRLTRLGWEARVALADGRPLDSDPVVAEHIRALADYLLFVDEAELAFEVTPRPGFAEALARRAPADRSGRSLAALDLKTRLLRHPLSFLVYSEAFDALPDEVRQGVYRRLFEVLSGRVGGRAYAHLTAADRRAIVEILRDTRPDLPAGLPTVR